MTPHLLSISGVLGPGLPVSFLQTSTAIGQEQRWLPLSSAFILFKGKSSTTPLTSAVDGTVPSDL